MKKLFFVFIVALSISCQQTNPKDASDRQEAEINLPSDTIKTANGLQYFYIKKGQGRKITKGSYVKAYNRLYLNDADAVCWSSDNLPDSAFDWIHGKAGLIKGAGELYPLLREGDQVVAITRDSIGYGKEGRANLHGGATLVFNPIIIKSVSEPKEIISDTLIATLENKGLEQMISVYDGIKNSELKDNYHFMTRSFTPSARQTLG